MESLIWGVAEPNQPPRLDTPELAREELCLVVPRLAGQVLDLHLLTELGCRASRRVCICG
jgi:hypothetical protein